jgi:hypothetical protein
MRGVNVNENSRRGLAALFSLFALTLVVLLAACDDSDAALSNVRASTYSIVPGSFGIGKPPGVLQVSYRLGFGTVVAITLHGPRNTRLFLGEQKAGDHILRFDGTTLSNDDAGEFRVVRSVVPSGAYSITVEVDASDKISQSVYFSVESVATNIPSLQNITIHPQIISPNGDAIDDVAEATFRTTQTATLRVDLYDSAGNRTPVLAPVKKGPGEQNVVINGQNDLGDALPDGVYTATIQATDPVGNRVEASKPITIEAGGQPDIEILSVDFTPKQIIAGNEISVTIKVKNTGKVPLRTQGPDPGYTYTTNDTYASIEGNKWTDKAGLWRVGVDWDGNSGGGGAYRYPFRWGFGHTLMPGEEAVTGGKIRILKQERIMWFFAGVLQEGVRIVLDRLGRTQIGVDF